MIKKISVCIIFFLMTFYLVALVLCPSPSDLPKKKPPHQDSKKDKIPETKKEPEKQHQNKERVKNKMVKVRRIALPPELLAALPSPLSVKPQTSKSKPNNVPTKKLKSKKPAMIAAKITPSGNVQNYNKKSAPKKLPRKVVRISKSDSFTGAQMKKEGQQLPVIEASWDGIGFDNYLSRLLLRGGRLYVGNVKTRKIVAEVDVHNYNGNYRFLRFINCFDSMMNNMALFRPREIVNEMLIDEILLAADKKWSSGSNYTVVILLPADIED
jgi:hypothetical protein